MTINLAIEYPNKSFDDSNGTIRPGYKQTEVGVIPVDWEVRLVAEAFDICNNLRFPLSAKTREGMSGSYPYYGPTKIQDYLNEYRVEGEFALIGEDGDHFLKFDVMPQTQYATGQFNVNNHAHLIKGKIASAKWFFWFFRNRDISQYLTRQGAGRFKLNKASLESMPCALPSLNEQTAIASALSDVDALIQELEKLITKKQAIKTATMQQLLTGRTRLPQFAHHPDGRKKGYKPSELGEIPEDWEVCDLGNAAKVQGGFAFKSDKFATQGVAIIRIGNIQSGLIDTTDLVYYPHGEQVPKQFEAFRGDALIAMSGATTGKVGIYDSCDKAYTNQRVGKFVAASNNVSMGFIHQLVSSELYKNLLESQLEQGAQPNVSSYQLETIQIRLPSDKTEQEQIALMLTEMDQDLQGLDRRLSKTRQIKQGMMQELLTGRTRLVKSAGSHTDAD